MKIKVKIKKNLEEMSSMGGGSVQGYAGSPLASKKENEFLLVILMMAFKENFKGRSLGLRTRLSLLKTIMEAKSASLKTTLATLANGNNFTYLVRLKIMQSMSPT